MQRSSSACASCSVVRGPLPLDAVSGRMNSRDRLLECGVSSTTTTTTTTTSTSTGPSKHRPGSPLCRGLAWQPGAQPWVRAGGTMVRCCFQQRVPDVLAPLRRRCTVPLSGHAEVGRRRLKHPCPLPCPVPRVAAVSAGIEPGSVACGVGTWRGRGNAEAGAARSAEWPRFPAPRHPLGRDPPPRGSRSEGAGGGFHHHHHHHHHHHQDLAGGSVNSSVSDIFAH